MKKVKSIKKETFGLTKKQLLYLELYTFGYDNEKIYDLLGVDNEYGEDIKYFVKKVLGTKLKTNSWNEIIKKSFELGTLNKNDYLNPVITEQANIFTEQIFSEIFMDEVSHYVATEPIKHKMMSYLNACKMKIEDKYKVNNKASYSSSYKKGA